MTNSTSRVLSVNSSGDVILVDDQTGPGGGGVNYCTGVLSDFLMKRDASSGNLCVSGVYEVPSGFGSITNNIGIGTGANNNMRGKLNVNGNVKIGTNYSASIVNGPADGLLVEGNTGIGRSNGTGLGVQARLHLNTDATYTGFPNPNQRNFLLGTASDRSGYQDAFLMFTNGPLGNETATIRAVGRNSTGFSGEGRVEALISNIGVRLTSSVDGSNVPGLEPVNQGNNMFSLGGDTIFPNETSSTTCNFSFGAYLGNYTHQWGRVYTNDIMQAPRAGNPLFFRIRAGNNRDVDNADCAMYLQTGLLYDNASYFRIIGPSTGTGANFCNNNGIGSTTPIFDVGPVGNVGINGFAPAGPNTTLFISGGTVLANAYNVPSDTRIKSNINDYNLGLDAIRNVEVKSYKYNGKAGIKDTSSVYVGVMAQEVMQHIPYAVDSFNYRMDNPTDTSEAIVPIFRVNSSAVLYTAINAIKQLDSKNQELENQNQELAQALAQQNQRIDEMIQRIDQCCAANPEGNRSGQINQYNSENNADLKSVKVELSNVSSIVLNQNEPNPFKDKTIIKYTIPNEVNKAEIIFFDKNGSIIKSVLIETRGAGQMEVYSSNLSAGTYSYSLVADGISIDTKKMVNIK